MALADTAKLRKRHFNYISISRRAERDGDENGARGGRSPAAAVSFVTLPAGIFMTYNMNQKRPLMVGQLRYGRRDGAEFKRAFDDDMQIIEGPGFDTGRFSPA